MKEVFLGSRKRKIATAIALPMILLALTFSQQLVSGTMWALGVQDLSVNEDRFSAADDTNEASQVQEDYSDEIDNLTRKEYYVTQKNGTEKPFQNQYYDNKQPGIYVDVVSGDPLFSSKHKFDSGTGWPSFYKPLEPQNVIERRDPGPVGVRVEVASRSSKSHLGHIFNNPNTPTGLRYCLNSAALDFIPADKLEEEGYGEYTSMFETENQG